MDKEAKSYGYAHISFLSICSICSVLFFSGSHSTIPGLIHSMSLSEMHPQWRKRGECKRRAVLSGVHPRSLAGGSSKDAQH